MASFDIIGSKDKAVAIIEIRDDSEDEYKIAKKIMKENKNVKSVLRKLSGREGEYRTREYSVVVGNPNTEVVHKEYGYSIKIDPQKTYFSVREGPERQKIAKQVKPGQIVMVMFAGVGPYAIAIAKNQPGVEKVIGIDINPDAIGYMKENVRINKLSHKIIPILGDVKTETGTWYGKCDHIVMPLPLKAADFLDVALKCSKKGSVIHLYGKGNKLDGDVFSESRQEIKYRMGELGADYEIVNERIVLPYAPGRFKVCIEFKVL